jgi:hypothetical protein
MSLSGGGWDKNIENNPMQSRVDGAPANFVSRETDLKELETVSRETSR